MNMLCLGIETSCDETALALVDDGRLTASVMSSQADLHALFGGVVPELASREHGRLIGPLFDFLFSKTDARPCDVDVVAFARGPGLLGSLLVGASFAKAFAMGVEKPVIGINHLHAHLLVAGLENELMFPALGLLVSGGHTHIYLIRSPLDFAAMGRTIDDAAGEAFDKVGKLLGLPYPAGHLIDEMAQRGEADDPLFTLPYVHNDNVDFSFSGLKTAAATFLAQHPEISAKEGQPSAETLNFCASLQETIAATLRLKLERALEKCPEVRSVIAAGGVAANSSVRSAVTDLACKKGLAVTIPRPALCTDNGSMIAYAGWLLAKRGAEHDLSVSCVPRGMPIPDDIFLPGIDRS
jgi:N6-L-threonylcarbamoyladenine synthase